MMVMIEQFSTLVAISSFMRRELTVNSDICRWRVVFIRHVVVQLKQKMTKTGIKDEACSIYFPTRISVNVLKMINHFQIVG